VASWPLSLLRLQGPDSLRFLHGQSSQDLVSAQPGQWLSTCCISPTARMRAVAEVLVEEAGAWLVIRAGDAAAVHQALDRVLFPADAVSLGPLRSGLLLSPVAGGEASPLAAADAETWRPLAGAEGFWLGGQLLLLDAAAAERNPLGLEPQARDLLAQRRLRGEEQERWRLQLGLPIGPQELCEETNPFELGLAPRVSLSKGCYVGQETLAKLATYDGVRRQLRRWWVAADAGAAAALAPGMALQGPGGERAGQITSSLQLPGEDLWIGLALVRRQALSEPTLTSCSSPGEQPHPAATPSGTAAPLPDPDREAPGAQQPLALRISRPPAFLDPPVGAGSSRGRGAA
jgi:folate-binding protein YgfZ